jgi:hypothetical protein
MAQEMSDSLSQMDLNPVILRENGYVVVDAKLLIKEGSRMSMRG